MPAVHVDQLDQCSRVSFGWANAMLVTLVESALGYDCGSIAERQRLAHIKVGGRVAGVKPCLRALVGGSCFGLTQSAAPARCSCHCCPEQPGISQCACPNSGTAAAMIACCLQVREAGDSSAAPQNKAGDDPLYYETLETTMLFDTDQLHV
jgi:hypothetical protein